MFGHPRGLTVLFLTEMWEIFSLHGMRALFVYYMTKHLMIHQGKASLIYGVYTAALYLTPIFGGMISDRWLGRHRAVVLGGSVMALGHFMMASEALLFPALTVIALGNGFFLPNVPSQIPGLYGPGDPRVGVAFNVYYVGANLGGFLAPLVCGTLGELLGWHWGFAAAGVGMLGGLIVYVLGSGDLPPDVVPARARHPGPKPTEHRWRAQLLVLVGVSAAVVVFRVAYEQVGNTLPLWIDTAIDRQLTPGGWKIPMTWFQSVNPLLVISLSPLLTIAWTRAAERRRDRAPLQKMVIGAALLALAFLLLAGLSAWSGGGRVSWLWLAAFFGLFTIAELYVFPVGMSLFGRLSPPDVIASVIALWFLSAFVGNLLAGTVGALWTTVGHPLFFCLLAALAAASGALFRLLDQHVRRIDHLAPDAATAHFVPLHEASQ